MTRKPTESVDGSRLEADLEAILAEYGSVGAARAPILARLKQELSTGRAAIRRRFEEDGAQGTDIVRTTAELVDTIVRAIDGLARRQVFANKAPGAREVMVLVAVGGYGRGEMAPYSDVDLLFVTPSRPTVRGEKHVAYALYLLWDLGLKVGHATRSIAECIARARGDLEIRTAMLESRLVAGDADLFDKLVGRFNRQIIATTGPAFVAAKLAERDARHKQMGDSRYVVEPNVKEGKGGLRDLQTLLWIGRYLYGAVGVAGLAACGVLSAAEAHRFGRAQNFLWTVRCHLHYLADRPEERLTFDVQSEIAERMSYRDHAGTSGVERFMKHYYLMAKTVGTLTGIFCAAIEADNQPRPLIRLPRLASRKPVGEFILRDRRVMVADPLTFTKDPVAMLRLFSAAQTRGLDIHPRALWLVTQNLRLVDAAVLRSPEANQQFLAILTSRHDPETMLRKMNEAGLFGRFIPDFGRVVGQTQHDMYHVYTVDEHTIFAIGILSRIERGLLKQDHPLASEVVHKIQSRRALYVAVMCHDIAKGRGGDHSELGAEVVERLGARLGLDDEETETASWLVRYHLSMSRTAFKRDLTDPKSIRDFVELVQSPERLRLLLCLTVCDIRAVGPTVWNGWKAALLRDLYWAAEDLMTGAALADVRDDRVAWAKDKLREALADWDEHSVDAHLKRGYPGYWLTFETDTLMQHANLIAGAETDNSTLAIDCRVDTAKAMSEVTVYAVDHAGLFSQIAGALAAAGANVVDARIFTTPQGMALDVFLIQDGERRAFAGTDNIKRLKRLIESAIAGQLRLERRHAERHYRPARTDVFKVAPRVIVDNGASASHTVIEVNSRDRPGLLHDVTRALWELSLQVTSAKIATYGERAVDVFYVRDSFFTKIEDEEKVRRIRDTLLTALGAAPSQPATATKVPASAAAE